MQTAKREPRPGNKYVTGDKKEYDSKGHHIFNQKTKKTAEEKTAILGDQI